LASGGFSAGGDGDPLDGCIRWEPLTALERVICSVPQPAVAHAAVGITAHAMQSMAVK
jgi:hypothetical protein